MHNNNIWDGHGHGTHLAGTIGACGTTGWALRVSLAGESDGLECLHDNGTGDTSASIGALEYAVKMGAKVSTTVGDGSAILSQILCDAIERAGAAGHLFVAAPGISAAIATARCLLPSLIRPG